MRDSKHPYKLLGSKLRRLRHDAQESLSDVSAAIEVDTQFLLRIEAGLVQPSEDILILLMNHFDVDDKEALYLWQQANYEKASANESTTPQIYLIPMLDNKILYTHQVDVQSNKKDIVINFSQPDIDGSPTTTMRVGMSNAVAQELHLQLSKAITHSQQPSKLLPTKTTTEEQTIS